MKHAVMMAVAVSAALCGCGEDEPESKATFQVCFDDLPDGDPAIDKILDCCLDTVIAGKRYACGTTSAECINYLTANLNQTAAGVPEVQSACDMYADMRPEPVE